MRRILLRLLLIIVVLSALGLAWVFAGRHVALLVDRFGTAEIERIPITQLTYEGAQSGGLFRLGNAMLSTTGPDNHPFPLILAPGTNNKMILSASGKSFTLGEIGLSAAEEPPSTFTIRPDAGDEASLAVRRSFLSWPTPFDFNFMTGHSPSWKRYRYQELVWKKQSGAQLRMLWRYEQYFYPSDGWTEGNMTREGVTGLILTEIKP